MRPRRYAWRVAAHKADSRRPRSRRNPGTSSLGHIHETPDTGGPRAARVFRIPAAAGRLGGPPPPVDRVAPHLHPFPPAPPPPPPPPPPRPPLSHLSLTA